MVSFGEFLVTLAFVYLKKKKKEGSLEMKKVLRNYNRATKFLKSLPCMSINSTQLPSSIFQRVNNLSIPRNRKAIISNRRQKRGLETPQEKTTGSLI